MAGLTVTFTGDASQLEKTFAQIQAHTAATGDHLEKMSVKMAESIGKGLSKAEAESASFWGNFKSHIASIGLSLANMAGSEMKNFFVESVKSAAELEANIAKMTVTLGSHEEAVKRVNYLRDESEKQPFQARDLIGANVELQNLGGTALATGEGLKLVADAAAQIGGGTENYKMVASLLGRIAQSLSTGAPSGRAALELQSLGLFAGGAKQKLAELVETMIKASEGGASLAVQINAVDAEIAKINEEKEEYSDSGMARRIYDESVHLFELNQRVRDNKGDMGLLNEEVHRSQQKLEDLRNSTGAVNAKMQELTLTHDNLIGKKQKLLKAQEANVIGFMKENEVVRTLKELLKNTEGMSEKLMQTTTGKFTNFEEKLLHLQETFGSGMLSGLNTAMDVTGNKLQEWEGAFKEVGKRIGDVIGNIMLGRKDDLIAAGIGAGEYMMIGMTTAIKTYGPRMAEVLKDALFDAAKTEGIDGLINASGMGIPKLLGFSYSSIKAKGGGTLQENFQSEMESHGKSKAMEAFDRLITPTKQIGVTSRGIDKSMRDAGASYLGSQPPDPILRESLDVQKKTLKSILNLTPGFQ